MKDELERFFRHWFGAWLEESDIRHLAKIVQRAMLRSKKTKWEWER